MKTNHLINEKSPYLQQHVYNPVDWYPWCNEAFKRAASEDKPVFLSIGYSTCHWCHVMEKESFEDEQIAQILNTNFISIKVDREERPDLDKIYMDALFAMGQQGGWPLNIFLTPDKRPIMGGTYFPPKASFGRKSFSDMLSLIANFWNNRRNELLKTTEEITSFISEQYSLRVVSSDLPSSEVFTKAFKIFDAYYDETHHGFKFSPINKFPPNMSIMFLLLYYYHTGNGKALEISEYTLSAMHRGGIYDQIGGGIFRYSTDHSWLVPHFEKMLYDNSLYILALVDCYSNTNKEYYREICLDVIEYLQRDMKLSIGGIASAEDADSEGEEGKFYTWTKLEVESICPENFELIEKYWNITESGNFHNKNILHQAINFKIVKSELDKNQSIIQSSRNLLLAERNKRVRPLRDDKIVTSWNCLYIRAVTATGIVFHKPELISEAISVYNFIMDKMFDSNKRLHRRYMDGELKHLAYLKDYAELAFASLLLYRATFETKYIQNSVILLDDIIRLFDTGQGVLFDTGLDAEKLLARPIDVYDGVEPSGNSTIAHLLLRLCAMGIRMHEFRERLESIFRFFKKEIENTPVNHPSLLSAYYLYCNPITEIVVIGDESNLDVQKTISLINSIPIWKSVVVYSNLLDIEKNSQVIPLLKDKKTTKEYSVYICRNQKCEMPIYKFVDFVKYMPLLNQALNFRIGI